MIESTSVCRCQGNGHCRVIDGLDSRQPYVLRLGQEGVGTLPDHWPPKYFPPFVAIVNTAIIAIFSCQGAGLVLQSSDVFFVTLNKADKDYSPTTMYNDYSINSELFHWQSQSTTAENSPHRPTVHPPSGARQPRPPLRPGIQIRPSFRRCGSLYLPGHGHLREA